MALKRLWRLLDQLLSLIPAGVVTLVVVPMSFLRKRHQCKVPVLASLIRMEDTSDVHLRLNSQNYIENYYTRPFVKHSLMLCVGDGKTKVRRIGRRVIAVDINLVRFGSMANYLPRTTRTIRDTVALFVCKHFISKREISVVETMSPSPLMWRGTMLKWLLPIKLVTQVRGNLDLILASKAPARGQPMRQLVAFAETMRLKILAQAFFRSCDLVVGYNRNNKENAISNGAHPKKTYLSRIQIDREILNYALRPRADLESFPSSGRVVCLWSRLGAEKYVAEALDGVTPVLEKQTDVHLVIIGDGEARSKLEEMRARSKFRSRIHFTGYQARNYIRSAAEYSDVVIVPYAGSSLVEAALLEKPVVAFDIEWHSELIRDGETGWLVDYRSPDHIATAVNLALSDPDMAGVRAKRLRECTERMFEVSKILNEEARIMLSIAQTVTDRNRTLVQSS